jgi:hypothetical protein
VSKARAEVTIDASCITNEELERDDIPKAENSKSTVLREPSDLPSSSRVLILVAAIAQLRLCGSPSWFGWFSRLCRCSELRP